MTLSLPARTMVWPGVGQPHELREVTAVELGPGDALVAVELATICGSDLHTTAGHRSSPAPSVLGHEQVGTVVALGAVDGTALAIGDRVVWSVFVSCGQCDRCARGLQQKCRSLGKYGHEAVRDEWQLSGGFASHVHVRAGTAIVRVPDSVSAELAAPASCGTATAWAALEKAEQVVRFEGATVLISGAGLIGLTATAMARERGARVIVSDPDESRRELAERFGAAATIDPTSGTPFAESLAIALAEIAAHDGVDVAIEASGSSRAVEASLAAVAVGGVLVLVGSVSPAPPVALDPERVVRGLLTIRGVHNYGASDLSAAVAFLAERGTAYPFASLVGGRFELPELDEAITVAARGDAVRVAVAPG